MVCRVYVSALVAAALFTVPYASAQVLLEEVLVTAQKREQRLQDVPLALTAVDGKALETQHVTELEVLTAQLPNVYVGESAIGDKLFIRGVGSGINAGFEQAVATFVDGVYYGRSLQSRVPFLDLERIEVLRGPQSTFFGNNAIAGALNMTTRQPVFRPSGYLHSFYEAAHDEYHLQGAAGIALADTVALRVAGLVSGLDGWVHNRLTSLTEGRERNKAARGSFAWQPNDSFSATFKMEGGKTSVDGRNVLVQHCPPATGAAGTCRLLTEPVLAALGPPFADPLFVDFDAGALLQTAYNGAVPASFTAAVAGPGAAEATVMVPSPSKALWADDHSQLRNRNTTLTLRWELPGYRLTAISAYSRYRFRMRQATDFVPLPLAGVQQHEQFSMFSQELRVESAGADRLGYTLGAYHHIGSLGVDEKVSFYLAPPWFQPQSTWFEDPCRLQGASANCRLPATIAQILASHRQHEHSNAVFASLTWQVVPALRFALGARFASVSKQLDREQSLQDMAPGVTVSCPGAADCAPGTPLLLTAASPPRGQAFGWRQGRMELQRRDHDFSPSANVQWTLRRTRMLYGSYTRGFKAGGFDQRNLILDAVSGQFEPEWVEAWEFGMKLSSEDRARQLNLAIFRSDYESLQVSTFDGLVNFRVNNAASARTQGVETDLQWHLSDRFVAGAALAVLDARWRDFRNAQCRAIDLAQAPSAVCHADAGSALQAQNLSGKRMLMSPRWSASINLGWRFGLGRGLALETDVSLYAQDKQYLAADNDPATLQGTYRKMNLRIALAADSGWSVALVVRNLADEQTLSHVDDLPLGSVNSFFALADRPRTVALQALLRW